MSEKEIADKVRGVFSPYLAQRWHRAANLWERVSQRWQPTLQTLLPLGGHSDGNKITLYTHGDDAFGAKWDAIQKVRPHIFPHFLFLFSLKQCSTKCTAPSLHLCPAAAYTEALG
jgi:hypothetical protein